jgi:queuosine precursor transporter
MTRQQARRLGSAALVAYIATVFGANYFITHVGNQPVPGGPHTIPVGFGLTAPSGVLFVGLAFTLRDFVQSLLGRWATVGAIVVGAALSYLVAPSLAFASAAAFLLSEGADFAVYTPLVESGRVVTGIALSNIVGTLIDTFLFLWLAFHSIQFWQGQVVGKLWMTALAMIVIVPARRRVKKELVPA